LTSVELRNLLQNSLGHPLPATVAFDYATVDTLTDYLAGEVLGLELAVGGVSGVVEDQQASRSSQLEQSPAAEVAASIESELAQLKNLLGEDWDEQAS